jgi:hypothetical protein
VALPLEAINRESARRSRSDTGTRLARTVVQREQERLALAAVEHLSEAT